MSRQLLQNQGAAHRLRIGRIGAVGVAAGVVAATALTMGANGASKTVEVSGAKTTKLGTYLVSGRTLYTLNKSDCTAKCLTFWPALLLPKGATKAVAGSGVSQSKLGSKKIASGLQVTYGGKPLYWFYKDSGPGKVTGNKLTDTWGTWTIVVTEKPKAGGGVTTTTAPSGGGTSF